MLTHIYIYTQFVKLKFPHMLRIVSQFPPVKEAVVAWMLGVFGEWANNAECWRIATSKCFSCMILQRIIGIKSAIQFFL